VAGSPSPRLCRRERLSARDAPSLRPSWGHSSVPADDAGWVDCLLIIGDARTEVRGARPAALPPETARF
jgi:hypothetical protein